MNAIDIDKLSPEEFFELPELAHTVRFAVIDRTGDTRHSWDPQKPAEVTAARAMFESLRAGGYDAFRVAKNKDTAGEMVREFDPSHGAYLFTPRMVGG